MKKTEMNADQLWDTTLNPAKRHLLLIKIDLFQEEDTEQTFKNLLGKDASFRRELVMGINK